MGIKHVQINSIPKKKTLRRIAYVRQISVWKQNTKWTVKHNDAYN